MTVAWSKKKPHALTGILIQPQRICAYSTQYWCTALKLNRGNKKWPFFCLWRELVSGPRLSASWANPGRSQQTCLLSILELCTYCSFLILVASGHFTDYFPNFLSARLDADIMLSKRIASQVQQYNTDSNRLISHLSNQTTPSAVWKVMYGRKKSENIRNQREASEHYYHMDMHRRSYYRHNVFVSRDPSQGFFNPQDGLVVWRPSSVRVRVFGLLRLFVSSE